MKGIREWNHGTRLELLNSPGARRLARGGRGCWVHAGLRPEWVLSARPGAWARATDWSLASATATATPCHSLPLAHSWRWSLLTALVSGARAHVRPITWREPACLPACLGWSVRPPPRDGCRREPGLSRIPSAWHSLASAAPGPARPPPAGSTSAALAGFCQLPESVPQLRHAKQLNLARRPIWKDNQRRGVGPGTLEFGKCQLQGPRGPSMPPVCCS